MRFFYLPLTFIFTLSSWTQAPPIPSMLDEVIDSGQVSVSPNSAISGEYGTWTVVYTIGKDGIQTGGGIRVQCSDEWHSGPRNSANLLQTQDPAYNNYIKAYTSNDNAVIRAIVEMEREDILIKHAKPSLDGRNERYVFVVRVLVVEGALQEGDTVSVVYGDTSGGSVGYRAPTVSGSVEVKVALDQDGGSRFHLVKSISQITVYPGSAIEMMVHFPSQAVVGKPIRGIISLVDKEANPVHHAATIHLYAHTGNAEFPNEITLPSKKGMVAVELIPNETGVVRLRARTLDFELEAISNPIVVSNEEPPQKIYWGDLHSHSHYSWDGVGNQHFEYARDISGLDFYSMTDHSQYPSPGGITRGLSERNWDEYIALSNKFNDPFRFVTFIAYEISFGTPFGHHIVYFKDQPGVLDYPNRTELPQLWERLQEGNAITIPHHTGKFPGNVDLSIHDERFRRNFEMYSGHGLSEVYDPSNPLAFEHSLFTNDATSQNHPSHIQDAWKMGLHLSTIASSDDHRAHPGQPHYGLAAVRALELTREGIFGGLYSGNTYATTGAKIILDFEVDWARGGIFNIRTLNLDFPTIKIKVIGTDEISSVEILRYQNGDEKFNVIHRWEPETWEFEGEFKDVNLKPSDEFVVYYCRIEQRRWIRNRPVMAWSSPVFIKMQ